MPTMIVYSTCVFMLLIARTWIACTLRFGSRSTCKNDAGLFLNNVQKSFRDSLEEVYNLNKFPSRQEKMKDALDNDCSYMENVFHVCTASVTSEIAEDKALELIAKAVESRINKAKFYEQYIQRKIDIARAIGLVSTDGTEAT